MIDEKNILQFVEDIREKTHHKVIDVDGVKYVSGIEIVDSKPEMTFKMFQKPILKPISTIDLNGLIDCANNIEFLKNIIGIDKKAFIAVNSYRDVELFYIDSYGRRITIYKAFYDLFPYSNLNCYLSVESFILFLSSSFNFNKRREDILNIVSNIKLSNDTEIVDNGINQDISIKTGVQLKKLESINNPFTLIPLVTFPEIAMPEHNFILRVRNTGKEVSIAIFSQQHSEWQSIICKYIKEYLQAKLISKNGTVSIF